MAWKNYQVGNDPVLAGLAALRQGANDYRQGNEDKLAQAFKLRTADMADREFKEKYGPEEVTNTFTEMLPDDLKNNLRKQMGEASEANYSKGLPSQPYTVPKSDYGLLAKAVDERNKIKQENESLQGNLDIIKSQLPTLPAGSDITLGRASIRTDDPITKQLKQAALTQHKEDAITKRFDQLNDDIDPNKARAGNFAKSQAMVNASDRALAIFKQFPDYNVPKSQTTELATATGALIGGGSLQSQHQLDALTPQSMRGDAQAIAGWLTNEPQGLQQQAFMKAMHDSVLRERQVALQQVNAVKKERQTKYADLKKNYTDRYNATLAGRGLDPEGNPLPPPGETTAVGRPANMTDDEIIGRARAEIRKGKDRGAMQKQLDDWKVKGSL